MLNIKSYFFFAVLCLSIWQKNIKTFKLAHEVIFTAKSNFRILIIVQRYDSENYLKQNLLFRQLK